MVKWPSFKLNLLAQIHLNKKQCLRESAALDEKSNLPQICLVQICCKYEIRKALQPVQRWQWPNLHKNGQIRPSPHLHCVQSCAKLILQIRFFVLCVQPRVAIVTTAEVILQFGLFSWFFPSIVRLLALFLSNYCNLYAFQVLYEKDK